MEVLKPPYVLTFVRMMALTVLVAENYVVKNPYVQMARKLRLIQINALMCVLEMVDQDRKVVVVNVPLVWSKERLIV
jgi:hypothetical protein